MKSESFFDPYGLKISVIRFSSELKVFKRWIMNCDISSWYFGSKIASDLSYCPKFASRFRERNISKPIRAQRKSSDVSRDLEIHVVDENRSIDSFRLQGWGVIYEAYNGTNNCFTKMPRFWIILLSKSGSGHSAA